jgi:DNA-binding response OmpR family regulator
VDDEQRITELIARWLQLPRYRVTTAETAAGALVAAEQERPDVIISDKLLPVHSGLWLLQEVRQRWGIMPPIILISGAPFTPDERHVLDALGNTMFLQKPFSRDELDSALARLL